MKNKLSIMIMSFLKEQFLTMSFLREKFLIVSFWGSNFNKEIFNKYFLTRMVADWEAYFLVYVLICL